MACSGDGACLAADKTAPITHRGPKTGRVQGDRHGRFWDSLRRDTAPPRSAAGARSGTHHREISSPMPRFRWLFALAHVKRTTTLLQRNPVSSSGSEQSLFGVGHEPTCRVSDSNAQRERVASTFRRRDPATSETGPGRALHRQSRGCWKPRQPGVGLGLLDAP